MKVVQFTVPVPNQGSVCVQEDLLLEFYNNYHRHKEIQVTYILKGQGTFLIGNFTHQFKEDEIYIVDANEPHMFKRTELLTETMSESTDQEQIHAIHVFFDYNNFKDFLQLPELGQVRFFLENISVSKKLDVEPGSSIKRKFLQINEAEGLDRLTGFIGLIDYLSEKVDLWTSLYTGIPQKKYSDAEGIRINEIFQYTFEHFADKISLEDISGIAHMTPHAFCKYFKKHTRKTYITFLNEIRIEQACKMLIHELSENVSDVAFKTGFNNVVNFNRVFKKITKQSPSEYLAQHKIKDIN
ncbi:AraC family transcriptional regulator [Sphingobacterium sp. SRCM116780]|uniref:AraC family transcriptional regulator n=1 Tax=Sphingobacterium sp. SRCM116780 TaxID=2907623 RepID=UPI001F427684|nr:AraC family transcriptional regulator [Sphingobacterium sp. SRCM116780]UIR56191.1 AraC family transcriptional regulator [Sphingobacterium sp. SRCM116780]